MMAGSSASTSTVGPSRRVDGRHPLSRRSAAAALAQPVLALGNFDGLHRGHRKILERVQPRRRRARRDVRGDDVRSASAARRAARQGAAAADDQGAEARGARATPACRARRSCASRRELSQWDPETFVRTVLVDWLRVVGSLGRREFPVRPRSRRQLLAAARARRALRLQGREDRSGPLQGLRRQQHAHPAAGQRRARGRGRRAARPSVLHRRHGRARRSARPDDRVSDRESVHRERAAAAATASTRRRRRIGRHRASVGDQHRRAADGRRLRADVDRDAHLRLRSRSVRRSRCASASSSGCATSARSSRSTRCARRSTPTARRARVLFDRLSL